MAVSSTQMVEWKRARKRRRREEATRRERERMHVLNVAFERLQGALPFIPPGARMPKMTIIESAMNYIQDLVDMLEDADNEELEGQWKTEPDEATCDRDAPAVPRAAYPRTPTCQCSCHRGRPDQKYVY